MPTISSDVWSATITDAHYAGGGNSGTLLAETSLVQGTDTLIAIDEPITVTYPTAIPEREVQHGMGAGLYANTIATQKVPPGTGSLNCWFQTDDWFDRAISGTAFGLPETFTWHTDNGDEELDHFGCWVEKLVITIEMGKPTLQEVTIRSRSWKAGNAMTKVVYQTGAKAYGVNASGTFDGHSTADMIMKKIVITILNANELEKSYGIGDNCIQHPALLNRTVTVAIDYLKDDSNTWAADVRNATPQLVDITIVVFTTLTITMTNLNPISTNTDENAHGIKQHTTTFQNGVGFTIA